MHAVDLLRKPSTIYSQWKLNWSTFVHKGTHSHSNQTTPSAIENSFECRIFIRKSYRCVVNTLEIWIKTTTIRMKSWRHNTVAKQQHALPSSASSLCAKRVFEPIHNSTHKQRSRTWIQRMCKFCQMETSLWKAMYDSMSVCWWTQTPIPHLTGNAHSQFTHSYTHPFKRQE